MGVQEWVGVAAGPPPESQLGCVFKDFDTFWVGGFVGRHSWGSFFVPKRKWMGLGKGKVSWKTVTPQITVFQETLCC